MNLFGMGIPEIVIILIVAMLIFGPGRIPEIGRQLGRGIRAFRTITTDLTKEFTKALDAEDKASSSTGGGSDKTGKSLLGKFLEESGKKDD